VRWSRLKSRVESQFASRLGGSVRLHQARYRHTHEEVGRVTITVDGREVAAFSTHMGGVQLRPLTDAVMDARGTWGSYAAYQAIEAEVFAGAKAELLATGDLSDGVALVALRGYLGLSIEAALVDPKPLVRGLAMLDRRLGKRRLQLLRERPDSNVLVGDFFALRCQAEGIPLSVRAV
jgi:hypothetical protein